MSYYLQRYVLKHFHGYIMKQLTEEGFPARMGIVQERVPNLPHV